MPQPVINKYQNAKIYCIRSPHTDKIYIGATCSTLSKRFYDHKNHNKTNTSSNIIIGSGDAYIELLEQCICNNKDELNKIEGEYIRMHKDKCVNIKLIGRSPKEYENDNKEKIKEKRHARYLKTKT
jgi:hypothetical protein